MAITSDLDNIVKWFEDEVCPSILLKVPDDKVNDGGYNCLLYTSRSCRDITATRLSTAATMQWQPSEYWIQISRQ